MIIDNFFIVFSRLIKMKLQKYNFTITGEIKIQLLKKRFGITLKFGAGDFAFFRAFCQIEFICCRNFVRATGILQHIGYSEIVTIPDIESCKF